jgi:hexosaminidase
MNLLPLVPLPLKVEQQDGFFSLNSDTVIWVDSQTKSTGQYLANYLKNAAGIDFEVRQGETVESKSFIRLMLNISLGELGDEGYELEVSPAGIRITAYKEAGVFWAVQTLRQLLGPETESRQIDRDIDWKIPCVKIYDKPRFPWRGALLDCGRHVFSCEYIKKFIDILALHKVNKFHWHLTEDQGWRIEISKYPLLTEIGAWRKEGEGKYGGFYTKQQIRDIVDHAAERFIEVIPEIEMPGHCTSVLAGYRQLSCSQKELEVANKWGVFEDVYCAGKESVFEFLENVLDEVLELFPSRYIHIGGDECPKTQWKQCPDCQERIKAENLADEDQLQSYFIRRICKYLSSKQRKVIVWDEIAESDLADDIIVMAWRGIAGGVKAAKAGNQVIMTPYTHCYFNYRHKELCLVGPGHSRKDVIISEPYTFDPHVPELTEEETQRIMGTEGCIWTEYIKDQQTLEFLAFPRMCELAEVAWSSQQQREDEGFQGRLKKHIRRLDALGINYHSI